MAKAAVVGVGFIGPVHVEALQRIGVTVQGILDVTAEKSQEAAQRLGLPTGYTNYEALLADPTVDVVHIATPNKEHFPMAQKALQAGKHVICEKPLAMNTQQTAELYEIARNKPALVSAVNYNMRFYPMVLQAREIVQSGELGDIYSVRGAYLQDWLLFDTDWNWRLVPEEGGNLRAIGDIGTHWMDTIGFITGLQIESLLADLKTAIPRRRKPRQAVATFKSKEESAPTEYDNVKITTEDWGAVLFQYANGGRGALNVSQVNAGRKNQLTFEIAGSKGAIAWDSERPNELWKGFRTKPNELLLKDPSLLGDTARRYTNYPGGHNEGYPDSFKQLFRAVYSNLQGGNADQSRLYPDFLDGHREVMLCEAILNSHQHRCWIDLTQK